MYYFYSDLHMYKAVLIVPDIYQRGHLRELMNLLLLKMGFGSCFLIQVSVFNTVVHMKEAKASCFRIMLQVPSELVLVVHVWWMLVIRKLQCHVLKMEFLSQIQG